MPGSDVTPSSLDKDGLCLLSLDGGGVRGLSTLYVLQVMMKHINDERKKLGWNALKPCEIFDLIGGTSTGGLIAIMLGRLEMDVGECIEAYKSLSKEIFENSAWFPLKRSLDIKDRFDSAALERCVRDIVQKHIGEGKHPDTELLNDGNKRSSKVFVTATRKEIATSTVRFRSYDSKRQAIPVSATICQAARATSAATTFFEPATVGDSQQQYADGGLGANNPIHEVWAEAKDIWSPNRDNLAELVKCCVSIGTGHQKTTPIFDGPYKFMTETLAAIATQTEKTAEQFHRQWSEMFKANRCFRFNVHQGLQEVGLEEYKKS
ncbi:acyl transferase/acyl hydrolase/lysophospholipase [Aspergillus ambiguus]|uniref:acyl transferase/acyl hydrolase/lysophospholipase n=1 Tax=Aspergillus ambiguus TaxID=176160 RepID=UPI003CCD524D